MKLFPDHCEPGVLPRELVIAFVLSHCPAAKQYRWESNKHWAGIAFTGTNLCLAIQTSTLCVHENREGKRKDAGTFLFDRTMQGLVRMLALLQTKGITVDTD